MWIISIILATLLAIYQTTSIICSYFNTSIKQSEVEVMNNINLAVTVCFSNPSSYNHANTSEKQIQILKKMANLSSHCDIYQPSFFCLSLLSEKERFKIGHPVSQDNFHLSLGIGIYQVFNTLLYGNCATLGYENPDINLKSSEMKLLLIFVHNPKQIPMITVIHEEKTFPVFKAKNKMVLNSINLGAQVNTKKTLFTSELFGVDCIAKTNQPMQRWNIKGNEEHNFTQDIYSYESCLDQCLYSLTMQYCKCILPNSMRGQNIEMLPLCHQYCNKIPDEVMETMCNCKFSCENIDVMSERKLNPFDDGSIRLMSTLHDLTKYSNEELTVKKYFKLIKEAVTFHEIIIIQSSTAKLTIVEPAIKLEDAVSTIGGIWGFWMGLSISVLLAMAINILPKSAKCCFLLFEKLCFVLQRCLKIMHKTAWFVGIIFIITIFICQLYFIITEYLRYNVLRVTKTIALDSQSFPSVYVYYSGEFCSPESELQNKPDLLKKINDYKMKKLNYQEFYGSITEEEKDLLLPKINDIIVSCELQTNTKLALPCPLQPIKLAISETTRCVIINASDALKFSDIRNIQGLKLKLQFPPCHYSIGMPMWVGFDPLRMEQAEFVAPGDRLDVKYSLTETNRLPFPYTSQCVDENTRYSLWPSKRTSFSHPFNYSYNFADCLYLCLYNLEESRKCIPGEIQRQQFNTSNDPCSEATNFDICGCKHSCRDRDYTFEMTKTDYAFKKNPKYINFTKLTDLGDYVRQGFAVVNIEGQSQQKTVISEKPTIEPDSLVGLIGGISGLWIGQSLLTIIIELHTFGIIIFTKILSLLKQ